MSQWYLSYDGRQTGPMDQSRAANQARANPDGYAWREGFTDWMPISKIAELSSTPMAMPGAPAPPQLGGSRSRADEIDFKICGAEMQFVEVELDPGESVVAEAGAMMYMTAGIQMDTIFGDGSSQQKSGIMGALLGAGKRVLTGESLFMTVFSSHGRAKERVAFAAPYPGRILAMELPELGGGLRRATPRRAPS